MSVVYLQIPIRQIGERHGNLRIADPKAERAMMRSMRALGQVSPVIVGHFEKNRCELIDGFKRLHAGRELNFENLWARVLPVGVRAAKAAMIRLNMKARTISDLEKGLVIQSLFREDRLKQKEIAALLDRHASWVCRRLALVERLCDEVMDHMKLGLINLTTGRELARLPRGNQPGALKTVLDYSLTSDETARLADLLLKEPGWNHESILQYPGSILEDRGPNRPRSKRPTLLERVVRMEIRLASSLAGELDDFPPEEKAGLLSAINRIESIFGDIRKHLETADYGAIHPQP